MKNFSIIIPLYNEELNLKNLIEEIFLSLENSNNIFEIILINDASIDNTLYEIKLLKKKYPNVINFLSNNKNLGQSLSLIEGIKLSIYKTIVTLDGDGQNNPKDIPLLLNIFFSNQKFSLVGGIRRKRKDSFVKIFSSKLANKFRKIILNDDCDDTGCSLKVFDKDVFIKLPYFNGIHRFLPALFKGSDEKTSFIDVDHRPRIHGYSKYGTFIRLFKGIKDLIRVVRIIKKFKRDRV